MSNKKFKSIFENINANYNPHPTKFQEKLIEKNYKKLLSNKEIKLLKNLIISDKLTWKDINWFIKNNQIPHAVYCKGCGKQIHLEKFGIGFKTFCSIKCMANDPDIITLKEKTNQERYGGVLMASPILSKKIKETNLKKFGVENPAQNKNIIIKCQETMLKRYGVKHSLQSKISLEKFINTCLKNNGVAWPMMSKTIRKKSEKTCLEKYGVSNIRKAPEIKEKIKQTNIKLYGVPNAMQNPEIRAKAFETQKKNGTMYRSKKEIKIFERIKELYSDAEPTNRKLLHGNEIDMIIPSKKIAIEFNGIYWHSVVKRDDQYHINKTNILNEQNWRLLHVWEDEYDDRGIDYIIEELQNIIEENIDLTPYKTKSGFKLPIDKFGLNYPIPGFKVVASYKPQKHIRVQNGYDHLCWNCGFQLYKPISNNK